MFGKTIRMYGIAFLQGADRSNTGWFSLDRMVENHNQTCKMKHIKK
jgi:hypothetical protein